MYYKYMEENKEEKTKCEKCGMDCEEYKCASCGMETSEKGKECCGGSCAPKCSGCKEADSKCAC